MKVGTINFHCSQTYGPLMAAYSMLAYLKKTGIFAQEIDCFPRRHTSMYPAINEACNQFINRYLSPFGNREDEYDLIIYGADTIREHNGGGGGYEGAGWSPDRLRTKKKIQIDTISDSTFLLADEDYLQVMPERIIPHEYAVIYHGQSGSRLFDAAKTVRQKTGLFTVELKDDGCLYDADHELLRTNIGPLEFLSLIKYSSYVLTASFHAVAFSIIFRKQFNTILESGDERVKSLLRKTGLQKRDIGNPMEIDLDYPMDSSTLLSLDGYIEHLKNDLTAVLEDIKREVCPAYIWGAAKYGSAAYDYCKNKFDIVGFIDKRAGAEFEEFCSKPVISPEQFFYKEKGVVNVIIAVSYPAEVTERIKQHEFYPSISVFDGHSQDNPLLYRTIDGEICVPNYMNKLFAEWEAYSVHYNKLSSFIFNMFQIGLEWVKKLDRDITICEIGCGSGQFANMLFDQGYVKYAGIDFSNQAIELARRANPGYARQFICKDAFSFLRSHKKEDYKLFIMFEVLEHLYKDMELLDMLPAGSRVILSVPSFKSFNHVRTFDSLESIKNRYKMLDITRYQEMPANKNSDKVYHLVLATKI